MRILQQLRIVLALPTSLVVAFMPRTAPTTIRSGSRSSSSTSRFYYGGGRSSSSAQEQLMPEKEKATYKLGGGNPFEFGDAGLVRPLLKQTQLEKRKLQVAYDANRDGYNGQVFHQKVDGKGAAIVLARCGLHYFGGYNPRGWASLGGSRPSVAAFLYYKTLLGWQKLRINSRGGNACSKDEYNEGIYFGVDSLVMPLSGQLPRSVSSRLGMFYECPPNGKTTVLPKAGRDYKLDELKVLVGVYEPGEDIPNSGGVTDLGLY